MNVSSHAIALIKHFEGLATTAYLCPAGVWTIGYGHTDGVTKGQKITEQEAHKLLLDELKIYERKVNSWCKDLNLTQGQFDALVCFEFNTKGDSLPRSTLLKKLKAGDVMGAADEFLRWNKVRTKKGGVIPLNGLTRRRKAERQLFLSDDK